MKRTLPLVLVLAVAGCAMFGEKKRPTFIGLSIQQVSSQGGGAVRAAELQCQVDEGDFEVSDLTMQLQFHPCNADPVRVEDGRRFLADPILVTQPSRPRDEFTPKVHTLVHPFRVGAYRVDPQACVTFRCTVKVQGDVESDTLQSRMCSGSVVEQRICSGGIGAH